LTDLSELKRRWHGDPEFESAYREADAEFRVIEALIRARTDAQLSQAELAQRMGTTQSAIARLEGGHVSPTLATLGRYADATGNRLAISLVRK
jgi:ribosome-binding protein aMBF1 (putative translation factor)